MLAQPYMYIFLVNLLIKLSKGVICTLLYTLGMGRYRGGWTSTCMACLRVCVGVGVCVRENSGMQLFFSARWR